VAPEGTFVMFQEITLQLWVGAYSTHSPEESVTGPLQSVPLLWAEHHKKSMGPGMVSHMVKEAVPAPRLVNCMQYCTVSPTCAIWVLSDFTSEMALIHVIVTVTVTVKVYVGVKVGVVENVHVLVIVGVDVFV
jgi:hypothetical protein